MIKINKVDNTNELSEVAKIAEMIWNECFAGIISKAQIDYMVEKFQSFEAMSAQIKSQNYCYYSVYDDAELCGYFAVKPEDDNRFFLSKLYLKKDKRGQGIARKMFNRIVEEAENCDKKAIYLTVNKHNELAINVYKKMGFIVADEAETDIGNGFVMDDYIMEYSI